MHEAEVPWIGLGFAILLAAAAVLLWRHASELHERRRARDFLARRLGTPSGIGTATNTGSPLGHAGTGRASMAAESSASLAERLGASQWMGADSDEVGLAAPAIRTGKLMVLSALPELPARFDGVVTARTLALGMAAMLLLASLVAPLSGWLAAAAALLVQALLGAFFLWWRLQSHRRQLVLQLPGFIDSVVRLITIGNSTQASFQQAIPSTREPLRACLERATTLVRAGVDLDRALQQVAAQMKVDELLLLASILGLGVRYGGRADLLLERIAAFMRDHEQAEHELMAMSAETRLSAWILGMLPIAVGGMIIVLNPDYFLRMWHDASGQWMIFGASGLQILGVFLLYRLARLGNLK